MSKDAKNSSNDSIFEKISPSLYVCVCIPEHGDKIRCCCLVAKSCLILWRPHGLQPAKLLCPCDSPGKNTGVGCHFLLQCMKVKRESEVAQSCPTPSDPMDYSGQAPLSTGFSRQEYQSGLPLPSPVDLPDPGIEPVSPVLAGGFWATQDVPWRKNGRM